MSNINLNSSQNKTKNLSLETETNLIRRAKGGDSDAAGQLIAQYEPLIKSAARRSLYRPVYDDALSTAYLALYLAILEYDEERGVNFAAWARGKVYGDLATFYNRTVKTWRREILPDGLHRCRRP